MKTLNNILKINVLNMSILALFVLASCSSTRYAANSTSNDDAYYSKNNNPSNSVPNGQQQAVTNTPSGEYSYSQPVKKTVSAPSDSKFDQSAQSPQPSALSYQQSADSTNGNSTGNYVTNNYYYDDYLCPGGI